MKSHMQLPHFLMRRFAHKIALNNKDGKVVHKECVYCLDIKSKSISEADISELNVQEGYYVDEAERILGEVESDFGNLVAEIKAHLKSGDEFFDLEPHEHTIKKFFYMAMSRSKAMVDKTIANSIFGELYPEVFNPSGIVMASEMLYKDTFLTNFQAMVAISSEKNFVMPKTCWYWGGMDTPYGPQPILTLPIMPTVAVVLIKKELKEAIRDNGYPNILKVDAATIKNANNFALLHEMRSDCEFLICAREDELRNLKEALEIRNGQ